MTPAALAPSTTSSARRAEMFLVAGIGVLCVVALLAPALAQDPAYHRFADARTLLGVPRAMDVLSNAGLVLSGLCGLALMAARRLALFSQTLRVSAVVFFLGFVFTGMGSAHYHLAPDDARLAVDRLCMVVALGGILGLVATQRVSERAGAALLAFGLLAGPASVVWWVATGSMTPYAVLHFGGLLTAALCLLGRPRGEGPNWTALILGYTLAKTAEHFDAGIFMLTQEIVSGHTLKHVLAALAAWAVIVPLAASGQAHLARTR
jgi:hypothetical protein